MRTKTLLLATAALAAGLVSSQAQSSNVYSANVVGYVNLPLQSGFNLIANQLDLDGTGTNNTVVSVFGTQLPSGSSVYAFAGGAFVSPSATYSSKGGWAGGTNAANKALSPGGGVYVLVPSAAAITMVGNVQQGALATPFANGYNLISSQVPQAGLMQTALGYVPTSGDSVYIYNPTNQTYVSPSSTFSSKGGWNIQPNLSVGQGVFLLSASPTGGTWSRNFTVQ